MAMGYVYLIEDINNNTFKIGVTKGDPIKRLKKLQTGNSTELTIKYLFETDYPYRIESMLHNHYNSVNERDEWFNLNNPESFIDKCNEFADIIECMKDNCFFMKNIK
jgi:hypothetical protein